MPGKVPCRTRQIFVRESLKILAQQRCLFEFLGGCGDLFRDPRKLL